MGIRLLTCTLDYTGIFAVAQSAVLKKYIFACFDSRVISDAALPPRKGNARDDLPPYSLMGYLLLLHLERVSFSAIEGCRKA